MRNYDSQKCILSMGGKMMSRPFLVSQSGQQDNAMAFNAIDGMVKQGNTHALNILEMAKAGNDGAQIIIRIS